MPLVRWRWAFQVVAAQPLLSELQPGTFHILQPPAEDGTRCGLDTPYEFLVKTPEGAVNQKELVLEFFGGGGCWDYATCNATTEGWQGGVTTKYWLSQTGLEFLRSMIGNSYTSCRLPGFGGLWNFCHEDHPFRNWTWLTLAYCTGDQHMGNHVATYDDGNGSSMQVRHIGAKNADSVLRWVKRMFPNLERIHVVGESAGGWATFAWTREVATRWPTAQVAGWSDSALHLLCPSDVCSSALPMVDDTWNATNHFITPSSSAFWTAEAIRQPSWSLADLLVEALESMGGRMSFGIFTRSADADQLLYWTLFGGNPSVWTGRMVSLVNEMEQRLPPALLRSYVVNGSTHGMHRTEELWTMEYRGVKFRDWLGNLSNCWVPVESMRVWDPLVGSKGTYAGDDENVHTCTTTTTTVTGSMSAAATAELCMPLLATAFTTVGALVHA